MASDLSRPNPNRPNSDVLTHEEWGELFADIETMWQRACDDERKRAEAAEAQLDALRSRYDEAVGLLRETFDYFDGENLTFEYAYHVMKNARYRVVAFLATDTATQGAGE